MYFVRRTLSTFAALVLGTAIAAAGHYKVTYTSPNASVTVDDLTLGQSYTASYDSANGVFRDVAPSGYVNCQGAITATVEWVADPLLGSDPPPDVVIIEEVASAQWTGDSGNCSDGLGDAEQDGSSNVPDHGPQEGLSRGVRWTIKQNPGQSFTLTCSPTAYGFGAGSYSAELTTDNDNEPQAQTGGGTGGGGGLGGPPFVPGGRISGSVGYAVHTSTPRIFNNGAIPAGFTYTDTYPGGQNLGITTTTTKDAICAGQPFAPIIKWYDEDGIAYDNPPAAVYSPANGSHLHWWSNGNKFANWSATIDLAEVTPADISGDTPSWRYIDGMGGEGTPPNGPEDTSVNCSFHLYDSLDNIDIGDVSLARDLTVWRPWAVGVTSVGTPSWLGSAPDYSGISMGGGGVSSAPAVTISSRVGTPSLFSQYFGANGSAAFIQLAEVSTSLHKGFYGLSSDSTDGFVLDLSATDMDWAYNPPWEATLTWDPNANPPAYVGGSQTLTDSPGFDSFDVGGLTASSYSIDDKFRDWVMFLPPGQNPAWIPSLGVKAEYNNDTWWSSSSGDKPWPDSPPGPGNTLKSGVVPVWEHPTWNGYHRSSAE